MIKIKPVLAILFGSLLVGAVSCIKKDDLAQISQVLLVPLSPDAAAVDFSINDQVLATTVGYSTTVGTVTYTLPYYTVAPGTTKIEYNITGTETPYASVSTPIENDQAYSTFLIDSASRIKLALVKDNVTEPTPGKVKLRFFHFSPNAGALDVAKSGGAVLFTNRSFNDQTNAALQEYIEVDPGLYQFVFRATGTTTPALYTTSSLNLLPDRVYTLAARGSIGGTGNRALGAWWYANRP
jgi:hypothetical protein